MGPDRHRSDRKGLYYGWYVVAAMFFMALVGVGPRQGLGLFFDRWTVEFGVSVTTLSLVASIGWVANGIVHPYIGWLTDRFGGRIVMSVSMVVVGLGTMFLGLTSSIWFFGFLYIIVVSSAMAGVLFVPGSALTARWFKRRRGTAMSFLTSGGSVGGMLLIPFMAYLFVVVDWRFTWIIVGFIMVFLSAPLLWFVLRNNPREFGLWPDGDDGPPDESAADSDHGLGRQGPLAVHRWTTAYRTTPMWVLTVTYVVCGITTGSIAIHFVPYAVSAGISVGTAALAFGVLNLINLMGVLATGVISDYVLRKNMLTVIYGIRGLAFVSVAVFPPETGLWVFAIVGGMSWLATVPQTGALVAEIYGIERAGTLNGMLTLVHQLGGAAAVFAAGLIFDLSGSYTPFFIIGAFTLAFASAASWILRERAVSVRFAYADSPSSVGAM